MALLLTVLLFVADGDVDDDSCGGYDGDNDDGGIGIDYFH